MARQEALVEDETIGMRSAFRLPIADQRMRKIADHEM
jgi:hypothetical protein